MEKNSTAISRIDNILEQMKPYPIRYGAHSQQARHHCHRRTGLPAEHHVPAVGNYRNCFPHLEG